MAKKKNSIVTKKESSPDKLDLEKYSAEERELIHRFGDLYNKQLRFKVNDSDSIEVDETDLNLIIIKSMAIMGTCDIELQWYL